MGSNLKATPTQALITSALFRATNIKREYLAPGEHAPHGEEEHRGKQGGRYYFPEGRGHGINRAINTGDLTGMYTKGQFRKLKFGTNGSNTFIVTVKPGTFQPKEGLSDERAVYKKSTQYRSSDGELLSYHLSELLGWNMVPDVVEASLKHGPGHIMRWVDDSGFGGDADIAIAFNGGRPEAIAEILRKSPKLQEQFAFLKAFDVLSSSTDRNKGNWILDPAKEKIWAIDNEFSFDADVPMYADKDGNIVNSLYLSNVLRQYGVRPIDRIDIIREVKRSLSKDEPNLQHMYSVLGQERYLELMGRVETILNQVER